MELADDTEHSRWNAKTSKDIPQKGSVDGVLCFGEVDKAHVQGGVLLPRQFLQSSYYEHHINRRALGSEATLFLRQNVLAFAIVTQATRDDFEEYCAGVSHEGDDTMIATLSPIFLLVKHLNRCIFPLLRCAIPPPHSDNDIMEVSEGVQFSFVGQNLQECRRLAVCREGCKLRNGVNQSNVYISRVIGRVIQSPTSAVGLEYALLESHIVAYYAPLPPVATTVTVAGARARMSPKALTAPSGSWKVPFITFFSFIPYGRSLHPVVLRIVPVDSGLLIRLCTLDPAQRNP